VTSSLAGVIVATLPVSITEQLSDDGNISILKGIGRARKIVIDQPIN